MADNPTPPPATREDLWQWALDNLPTPHDLARRGPPGLGRPTSVLHSFLVRLFRQPTAALQAIRSRTAYAARGIRNVVVGRLRRRSKDARQADDLAAHPDVGGGAAQGDEERRL